jgi:hypothetical protein
MTMKTNSLNYLKFLDLNIYSLFTKDNKFYPYPNPLLPHHFGKEISQYHFKTKIHPIFSELHSLWYKKDEETKRLRKIVPYNISEMFSEISLAYWIADDGYFANNGLVLCTESFTEQECLKLKSLLEKLDLKVTLHVRSKTSSHRIYISALSKERLIFLVKPHLHPDFLYKLGL